MNLVKHIMWRKCLVISNTYVSRKLGTTFDLIVKLQKNYGRTVARLEYVREIGCLMYLMQCRRHYITFAVSKMSRSTSNPYGEHRKAITKIFSYLLKTKILGLHYGRFPFILEGYTYASWISAVGDHKYTTR